RSKCERSLASDAAAVKTTSGCIGRLPDRGDPALIKFRGLRGCVLEHGRAGDEHRRPRFRYQRSRAGRDAAVDLDCDRAVADHGLEPRDLVDHGGYELLAAEPRVD